MSTSGRLGWSDYVNRYEEASDLDNDLQGDAANIESNSVSKAVQGWEDLSQTVYQNPIWHDLLSGNNSDFAKSYIQNIANQAQNYMSNVVLKVEKPNDPGHYINLYSGTSSEYTDDDGDQDISTHYNDLVQDPYDPDYWDAVPANLFEMISGKCSTLFNDPGNAQYDNPGGPRPGLWTDWSWNGSMTFNCEWDGDGNNNVCSCSACGSLQQWMPFIHLDASGADASALNAALQA